MLRVNDFFCGAGGMGLGFKRAGFQLAGAWDFDKWAVESYKNNVSPEVKLADIRQMTWEEIPHADVWTFGFPCQDISVAGRQAGMVKGETRSGLFYEVMRLLKDTEDNNPNRLPSIILAENVKAVNKYLLEIEKEYNNRGYKMYATIYNSKYWGVPQNRERFFILGVRNTIDKTFNFPKQQTDFIPSLSSVLDPEVDRKYYMDRQKSYNITELAKKRTDLEDTSSYKGNIVVIGRLDMKGLDIIRRVYDVRGISPTLTASEGGHRQPKILTDEGEVRKLTPREYARLQGFPDDYKQIVSDYQFYKQMGNAVTVNVSKAIAKEIKNFLEQD